jgi:hypothetical protein
MEKITHEQFSENKSESGVCRLAHRTSTEIYYLFATSFFFTLSTVRRYRSGLWECKISFLEHGAGASVYAEVLTQKDRAISVGTQSKRIDLSRGAVL